MMDLLVALVLSSLGMQVGAAKLEYIKLSKDGSHFVLSESDQRFSPWGFNYDHDRNGRLIEDYWHDEWSHIEEDFREMRQLGANVVRIHLQYGKFMQSPELPNQNAIDQLARLVKLAEATRLYLNLTGLGCYHKSDVPEWYVRLGEHERWQAQAAFWEAIAETCANSPAIFCYDLMNEPVVPGGDTSRDDWLGPPFAGKHFVQFISLDRQGRDRPAIAQQWIRTLRNAIRQHDRRHLITVGLVPWSLDRPGLTSGFVPEQIVGQLDFLSVHIYPETGQVKEALETLRAFKSVGKPVVIEETFPLKCSAKELREFIQQSQDHAAGWFGFYWGQTLDELRSATTIGEALTRSWLELFMELTPQISSEKASKGEIR